MAPIVVEGGPEAVRAHAGRTLMLMWPDYMGFGSYGLSCLEGYGGDTLVLIGEWRGRTLCDSTAGQSFSEEFQAAVEAEFVLDEEVRLPNWPFFLDTCRVWRRRATA